MKKHLCLFLVVFTICSFGYARIGAQQATRAFSWGSPANSSTQDDSSLLPVLSILLLANTTQLPSFTSQSLTDAETAIVAAGLVVGTVTSAYSDTVAAGNIISQDPPTNTNVPLGTEVDLVVSLGPEFITTPNVVGIAQADAEFAITEALLAVGVITTSRSDTVPLGHVISQEPAAGAVVSSGTAVNLVSSLGDLPHDPSEVAPVINPTVTTTTFTATEFLYSGSDPIQTGVAPGTIEPERAAVIRGKVLDKQNQPLYGVTITLLNHPEFGQTMSRADGMFDLAVNGGGPMTINYAKQGYLSSQRQIDVPWQDYITLPDVVLIQQDTKVSTVDLTTDFLQVARGSVSTDSDGSRQATLFFPQGTTAEMVMADGSTQALTSLNVRATEYTVGENGPLAMPAEMPANVGYTYAVELSVDEAQARGAKRVDFNQPIPFYIDNFLEFPIGGAVPLGYYDTDRAVWVPYENGRVIKIISITSGVAELDTTGDTVVDNGTTIGVTDDERRQLASLYPTAGKSLWRMQLRHFSTWDANWGWGGPPGATALQLSDQVLDFIQQHNVGCTDPCEHSGSVIESQNQTLGEVVDITGIPFALHYRSDRVQGRKAAYTINIPVSNDTIPSELKRIDLEINVAGRDFNYSLSAAPDQSFPFTWDGKDAYGRVVQGIQPALVRIGYVYDGSYQSVPQLLASFGYKGNGDPIGVNSRDEFIMWLDLNLSMGGYNFQDSAVGAWSPSVHHVYDLVGGMLYFGDGTRRSAKSINQTINTISGGGDKAPCQDCQATDVTLDRVQKLTLAPDGSLYFTGFSGTWQISPEGVLTNTNQGAKDIAISPDGSLYMIDGTNSVIRINPDNSEALIAGTGGFSGDGGPAVEAHLSSPRGIEIGPSGSLFIADTGNNRIRKISPDGIINTISGNGTAASSGDGSPAIQAELMQPTDVALSSNGELYIVELDYSVDRGTSRIRKIGTDGIISTIAGGGSGPVANGASATEVRLPTVWQMAFGPNGSLYFTTNDHVLKINTDNTISIVAGGGDPSTLGNDGVPATAVALVWAYGLAVGPLGNIFVSDRYHLMSDPSYIYEIEAALPGVSANEIIVPSEDGSVVYHFDADGRHLRTINALTNVTLYQFAYDSFGRLTTITDGDGDNTTIERNADGDPVAIIAPFGQRTSLTLDANGYLNSITNPLGEQYQMTYTSEGLLTEFQDPRSNISTMTYDEQGRLLKDQNAANGFTELTRTENQDKYTVTTTTAEGRQYQYQVGFLPGSNQNRINKFPDGTQNELLIGSDGSYNTTFADGTVRTNLETGDPRFGMQAPITKTLTTTTGGLTSTLTRQRAVILDDPSDKMSLTSQTDTITLNGRTTTSVFDATSKMTTVTSSMGRQSTLTVDTQGRPVEMQVTGLTALDFSYDSHGRLIQGNQGSRQSSQAYDPSTGFPASSTNALNQITSYTRDAVGRLTVLTLPDTTTWHYAWDHMDNLTVLTEPGGTHLHRFTYTPINQLETYQSPRGAVERFSYNKDRQLTRREYPSGDGIDWIYNNKDQLTTVQTPQGNHSFRYSDTTGQLIQAVSRDGQTVDYSYNGSLRTGAAWSNVVTGAVTWEYDNFFRTSRMTYPGADISLTYDEDSLLTGVGSVALSRNAANGLVETISDGAYTIALGRNSFGEINAKTVSHGSALYAVAYTRDDLGRIAQKTETIGGATHVWDYEYDAIGQLTTVKQDGTTVESYGYDEIGNRTSITNTLTGVSLAASDFTYDADSKLRIAGTTSYNYDADGRLSQENRNGSITGYQYNTDGTMATVTLPDNRVISYLYDARGRRIARAVDGVRTHAWLYGSELMPLAEFDGSGSLQKSFIYAGSTTPTSFVAGGATFHIVSDQLGSPRLIVDSSGTVVRQIDYDAFGNVISDSNPGMDLVFGFAGGMTDPAHELIRFGARDYQPSSGRWTAKDPILFNGELNLYGYVGSNPVNNIDPSGEVTIIEGVVIVGVGGLVLWAIYSQLQDVDTAGKSCLNLSKNNTKYTNTIADLAKGKPVTENLNNLQHNYYKGTSNTGAKITKAVATTPTGVPDAAIGGAVDLSSKVVGRRGSHKSSKRYKELSKNMHTAAEGCIVGFHWQYPRQGCK